MTSRPAHTSAPLPRPRGPVSAEIIGALADCRPCRRTIDLDMTDPLGDDLQLALYVSYELHYLGFGGVDDEREWDPDVIAFRRELEEAFVDAVRVAVDTRPERVPIEHTTAQAEMDALCVEPIDGSGISYTLRDEGTWEQFCDYFALRSLYHLKEADPHAWAIPRLRRMSKSAFVAVEFDEFGGGRGDAVHQELFADLLAAADLRPDYLAYLDAAPGWALAPVNLMSYFGLHRSMRGAAVGHLAATEITSPPGSQRLLTGLERLDAPEPCRYFYSEHVEADAVHEQILRTDVVGSLVADEPALERDIVFGIRGFLVVEDAFDAGLRQAWEHDILRP